MSASDPMRLNGAKFRRDKTGLVTITVPWEVYSIDDCNAYVPTVSAPLGFPITDRAADESEVGTWLLTLTYEGRVGPQQETEIVVELDSSMAQDPIQSHPNFANLKTKYGWSTEKQEFAEQTADPTAKANGLSGTASAASVRNPMYGVDSYLAVGAIFRVTITTLTPPGDLLEGVGTVVDTPPYWYLLGVPSPKGRNWLKLAPKARISGNATTLTYEHEMSGPNGWIKDVYGAQQLVAK